jgi:hypothetical protein
MTTQPNDALELSKYFRAWHEAWRDCKREGAPTGAEILRKRSPRAAKALELSLDTVRLVDCQLSAERYEALAHAYLSVLEILDTLDPRGDKATLITMAAARTATREAFGDPETPATFGPLWSESPRGTHTHLGLMSSTSMRLVDAKTLVVEYRPTDGVGWKVVSIPLKQGLTDKDLRPPVLFGVLRLARRFWADLDSELRLSPVELTAHVNELFEYWMHDA